jgi:hypothetical protein
MDGLLVGLIDGPFDASGNGFIDGLLVGGTDLLLLGWIDGPFDTSIDGFTDGLLIGVIDTTLEMFMLGTWSA